ncbi:unnamed protein product (macronuclear) [Paramecium tetraurelia]|uniref:CDT1 Geminin-binding domain-containing protein n=1 Tax=Paramecium tetraurelia TaxID=5888 RepID=A0D458_PARTE|nr:uncharacterized protein GSPATT00013291001 [Paramecium tetraurelia]CAK77825.1 unnamed protein product [Paramecium tetraurelia]|eukprot:XP_001445222.1 hypothetical protein (macronuclear) [Paramecium tetraurelia strain d4-2]
MNQQFSVEYLGIKPTRYNRLPNLNNNHYLNLSQEMRTSRTKKNLAQQKLHALSNKKDDPNDYYNHTTIYNVKENKDISKTPINQELSFSKYNELQTKLMVSDFKKKVDAYLKKNNQKSNIMSSKLTSSLKELELLQQVKNEELLNKSLCSNKYTVKTEKKSMKAMEIFILGNNKIVTKQVISSELIQQRLLKQMETFLKDDRFNYDLKMSTMIEQYAEIVTRIHEKAFTIKIPEKYIIQMSDYNEYYQIKEDTIDSFLENKLEIIADHIIQEIQQSKRTTPKILSHKTSEIHEPIVEAAISQTEDLIMTEPTIVHQQEIIKEETSQIEQIIPEKKVSNKKSRQRKKNQQPKNDRNQSDQSSLSEIVDSSLKNSNIKDSDDTRRRKKEKQKITNQAQIDEEEQDPLQKENEKQRRQKIIKKLREFNQLFKPKIFSRGQSENTILQIEEPIILAQPKQAILKTFSLRPADDTTNMKEIYEIIRAKKQQLYEYNQEQQRIQYQEQTIENSIQNQTKIQQKPLNLIVNGKHISEIKEAAELWDSKRNSPRSFTKQRQNLNNSAIPEQKQEIKVNEQIQIPAEVQDSQVDSKALPNNNPDNGGINYQQIINQKLISIEDKLKQKCQDIFDILLASEYVYDVKIDDYKIGKPNSSKINHPNFIFQQDQDEIVFTHQVLWRREIQQVIPKLNSVNKQMQVQINSEDEYIQDTQQIISEEEDDDEDKDDENEDSIN